MESLEKLKQEAETAFRKRHRAKAIGLYLQYFSQIEPDYFSLIYVAKLYMDIGLPERGLEYYDKAIANAPSHGTAFTRKSCYLLEKKFGAIRQRLACVDRKQISMLSLGHKCRFGNQIFQYAFLKNYGEKFALDIGTPIWPGSFLFGLDDPNANTQPGTLKESQVDMMAALESGVPSLEDRNITGFFQFTTGRWNQFRQTYQRTFTPCERFMSTLMEPLGKMLDGHSTLVTFHIRRGDYTLLDEFPTAPTGWYLDWLQNNWHKYDSPILYIATDDASVVEDFSAYHPMSYQDLYVDFRGIEFMVDWVLIREADVVAISNSSFSMSAAMANKSASSFWRPQFDNELMMEFDPWNSSIL